MLCYAMLCYAMLCYAIPYRTAPYRTVPYHAIPYHILYRLPSLCGSVRDPGPFQGPRLSRKRTARRTQRISWSMRNTVLHSTVSFHIFKSQNLWLSVSNPKSKYVAHLSVLSQIQNCQGLGRKNKHEILKTDRTGEQAQSSAPRALSWKQLGVYKRHLTAFAEADGGADAANLTIEMGVSTVFVQRNYIVKGGEEKLLHPKLYRLAFLCLSRSQIK